MGISSNKNSLILSVFHALLILNLSSSAWAAGSALVYAWHDTNGDGIQSTQETGVRGIPIEIYDTATGTRHSRAVTDIDGIVVFTDLENDEYFLCSDDTFRDLGYEVSLKGADNSFDWLPCSDPFQIANNTVSIGFGMMGEKASSAPVPPPEPPTQEPNNPQPEVPIDPSMGNAIRGRIWLDSNADGLQTVGENGYQALKVSLYNIGDGTEIAGTFSNVDGYFQFTDIVAADYFLCAAETFRNQGLTVTLKNAGNDALDNDFDGLPCTDPLRVTGNQGVTADLGLRDPNGSFNPVNPTPTEPSAPSAGNTISGRIWLDTNADGLQTAGENGYGSLLVALYVVGNGVDIATTFSAADGHFQFDNVAAGDYFLCTAEAFLHDGLTVTARDVGDNDALDNDFDGLPCTDPLLVTGNQGATADLGLLGETVADDGFIHVDGNTCTLTQAVASATQDIAIGGCRAGQMGLDTIVLQANSFHPSLELPRPSRFGKPIFNILANGATIDAVLGNAPYSSVYSRVHISDLTTNLIDAKGDLIFLNNATVNGPASANSDGLLVITDSLVTGKVCANGGAAAEINNSTVAGQYIESVKLSYSCFPSNN